MSGLTQRILFESKRWQFLLALATVVILKCGIWLIPNLSVLRSISIDPFRDPGLDADSNYQFWNWLSPFLGWLLRLNDPAGFFLMHLGFTLIFLGSVAWVLLKRLDENLARTSLLIFAALPVASTSLYWVSADSLTLLLILLVLIVRNEWLAIAAAIALGFQSFEQGLVAFGALTISMLIAGRIGQTPPVSPRRLIYVLCGLAIGRLALMLIFSTVGLELNSGRAYWLTKNLPELTQQFLLNGSVGFWALLGTGWIVLGFQMWISKERIPALSPVLIPLILLVPLIWLTQDQTRVLALVTFPLLATWWLFNQEFLKHFYALFAKKFLWIWLVIPWIFVWTQEMHGTVIGYDIQLALHQMLGWYSVPNYLPTWPFS